jgi:VWFA-related protein
MKRLATVAGVLFFVPFIAAQEAPVAPVPVPAKPAALATLSVVVTDSRGNHITSLSKDDFQVAIGGTPLPIEKFSERGAPGSPAGEVRRIAIFFDTTTLSPGARRQALDAVHGFLERTMRPGDMAAILAGGQSLRAATGWTSDLSEIDAGVQLLSVDATVPRPNGQAEAEKRIREIATDIQQNGPQPGRPAQTLYTFDALIDAARAYAASAYRDAQDDLSVISSAVSLFTPRTRNVLIVIGGGMPRLPGAGVFQYVETLRGVAERGTMGTQLQAGSQASSPMGESSSYDLTPMFNTFGTRAWRRGVVFYAIASDIADDSRGPIDSQQSLDSLAAFTNAANRFAGYHLLAADTSGVAFVGRPAADAFSRIASDLESFYAVGVHPTAPISGKNAIAMKVKNGYTARVARGSSGSGGVSDEMESRVIANQIIKPTGNHLGISLAAGTPVFEGERRVVTVDVLIPIQKLKLVQEGNDLSGAFTVFIATGDSLGHSSNVSRQTKTIHWPADALRRAGDRPLTFRVNVVLEPGRSQISIGVIDEQSQQKGFDRLTV